MTPLQSLYAVWYDRLAAYLVDALLLLIPSLFAVALMGSVDANGEAVIAPGSVLVVFFVQMAYYVFFLSGGWQATPGMRLTSIHLVRTDGRALSQRDGLERFLATVIPSLPVQLSFLPEANAQALLIFLHILWFAPILTTRTGLHDRLCNMRVINGRLS